MASLNTKSSLSGKLSSSTPMSGVVSTPAEMDLELDTVYGVDGATFTPSVDSEGIISWTNNNNLTNPTPRNIKGPKGDPFTISKTYSSITAMNADIDNMSENSYVMIANDVNDEDNAKLYVKSNNAWHFITDFSGAQGIKGDTGTITIGNVTSGATSQVTNSGTNTDAILNFVLEKGDAATINVGTTTTGAAGSSASVTNSGNTKDAVFNFSIPKGDKGDTGEITVGTVVTGTTSKVENVGTSTDAILNFTLEKGEKGDRSTVAVGTVTSGVTTSITNVGDEHDAILNFVLPKGDKGETGEISIGTVTTGSTSKVTNSGTSTDAVLNFTLEKGDKGDAATIQLGTVTSGATASVTNSGDTHNAILNFTMEKGETGDSGVYMGTTQPTNDEVLVWINPEGSSTVGVVTRSDVTSMIEEALGDVENGTY